MCWLWLLTVTVHYSQWLLESLVSTCFPFLCIFLSHSASAATFSIFTSLHSAILILGLYLKVPSLLFADSLRRRQWEGERRREASPLLSLSQPVGATEQSRSGALPSPIFMSPSKQYTNTLPPGWWCCAMGPLRGGLLMRRSSWVWLVSF